MKYYNFYATMFPCNYSTGTASRLPSQEKESLFVKAGQAVELFHFIRQVTQFIQQDIDLSAHSG